MDAASLNKQFNSTTFSLKAPITTLSTNFSAPPSPASDFEWSVENNVVTIDKFLPEDATSVAVPAEIDGRPVAKIGVRAFKNRASLTQIVLSSTIREIDDSAFSDCAALTQLELPPNVKSLGDRAFSGCQTLRRIALPERIDKIPEHAFFFHCDDLAEIVFSPNVKEIKIGAFYGCLSLSQIELPKALIKIGQAAFEYCTSLSQVVFPERLEKICDSAFTCSALKEVALPDGVKRFGRRPFPESTICRACPEAARKFANAQKPRWEELYLKAISATPEN